MNNARDVSQQCEQDVDGQILAAPFFCQNPQRWQEQGEDKFANVGASESHFVIN